MAKLEHKRYQRVTETQHLMKSMIRTRVAHVANVERLLEIQTTFHSWFQTSRQRLRMTSCRSGGSIPSTFEQSVGGDDEGQQMSVRSKGRKYSHQLVLLAWQTRGRWTWFGLTSLFRCMDSAAVIHAEHDFQFHVPFLLSCQPNSLQKHSAFLPLRSILDSQRRPSSRTFL